MALETPIPARMLHMEGTNIEESGMAEVRENRKYAVESGLPALKKDRALKGRVAIVGYGPSLKETWPRLKEFDEIWTTSRAHDWLVSQGITPTCHVDVDPRKHKGEFLSKPLPGVKYYLSTHVHPTYIDKVKAAGADVELFNVGIDVNERLDPRYPTLKVRFDAGTQAAEIAFQNGFREQHWFGIEYGRRGQQAHAGEHWGTAHQPGGAAHPDGFCLVDVDGRIFESTKLFVHGLLLAESLLCDRALLRATIHGDGLLGHFLKARGRVKVHIEP